MFEHHHHVRIPRVGSMDRIVTVDDQGEILRVEYRWPESATMIGAAKVPTPSGKSNYYESTETDLNVRTMTVVKEVA